MSTVYTYYDVIDAHDGSTELFELFKESWERHGWAVCWLKRDFLDGYPGYDQFIKGVLEAPSLHSVEHRVASYARYLAMLKAGGGLHVDMDVINYGFTPSRLPEGDYTLQRGSGPHGSPYFYGWLCYEMAHWRESRVPPWPVEGQPHWSDMIFLSGVVPWIDVCRTYREPAWERMPLVHYSNGSLFQPSEMQHRDDRAQRILAARPIK